METLLPPLEGNVSVIVLNFNRSSTTIECLNALERAKSPLIREVLVVDNGSSPDELATLRGHRKSHEFGLVEIGENRFFSEGNNIGAEASQGDYLVFLNNDAFVTPGWIEALASTFEGDPTVAAVGPMFLYPDGRVQEVGGIALPTGDVVQIGKGAVWGPDHYLSSCPVDFCSAACLMMRRSDFFRVGGFGYEWEPAYYEDTDLCLKIWTACGKVVVNPLARVHHIESLTTSDSSLRLQNISEINRSRFVAKWGAWLEARQLAGTAATRTETSPSPDSGLPVHASEGLALQKASRPPYILFSPYPVVPGGGERVMLELASLLSTRAGVSNVILSTPHRYSNIRLRQVARTLGFENDVATPVPLPEVDISDCQFAVILGNSIVPPIEPFGLRSAYLLQFPFSVPDADIEARGHWLRGFSEIWVYSDFVRRHVNGLIRLYGLPSPPIRVISPPAQWNGSRTAGPWAERRTILTVGRFFAGGHNKRQDVVIDIFRRLTDRGLRGFDLALAGSIHPTAEGRRRFLELQGLAHGLDSTFYPNAGRDELAELYARSAILVHAAGMGVDPDEFPEQLEHFGITPVEAASFGCIPVVFGEGGPKDVVQELGCATSFRTVDEAVEIIQSLLGDPAGSTAMSQVLKENSDRFSTSSFQTKVRRAIRDMGLTLPK